MEYELSDFNLSSDERKLFYGNVKSMFDMECGELFELLKYIFCEYTETLYAINNFNLGFNERELYCDIYEVFKNEDYMDMLDYVYEKNYASIELYDVGWCGYEVFYKKVDNYAKKLSDLGYNVEVVKDIFDENNGAYAQMNFKFN